MMMVRTMSESMMRRVAGRCGAHRLQAPSGARLHGSTVPRVHGFRAWERPSAGRGWRRAWGFARRPEHGIRKVCPFPAQIQNRMVGRRRGMGRNRTRTPQPQLAGQNTRPSTERHSTGRTGMRVGHAHTRRGTTHTGCGKTPAKPVVAARTQASSHRPPVHSPCRTPRWFLRVPLRIRCVWPPLHKRHHRRVFLQR